jgi:hypothetical protein
MKLNPYFLPSMRPAPVQEAQRAEAVRDAMPPHRVSAATNPLGFFKRPFGLPFGARLRHRAAQAYVHIRFSQPTVAFTSPKEQRRLAWRVRNAG